jgi:hypothetical protein
VSEVFALLVKALLGKLIVEEVFSSLDAVSNWVVRCAVKKLPKDERERYFEEWSSLLGDTPTPMRRFFRAASLYVGAIKMGREADRRLRRMIEGLKKQPKDIFKLTPRQCEELIAELFRDTGYDVMLTQATRDGGKDVLASIKTECGDLLCLVQAKHYRQDR